MGHLADYLGRRPVEVKICEDNWSKAQQLIRHVCEHIPALVDQCLKEPGLSNEYVLLMSIVSPERYRTLAAELLRKELDTFGIRHINQVEGLAVSRLDLVRVAEIERVKYEEGYRNMMRSR